MATLYVMSRGVEVGAGQICRVQVEALRSKDLTRVRQQAATTRTSCNIVFFSPIKPILNPLDRPHPQTATMQMPDMPVNVPIDDPNADTEW